MADQQLPWATVRIVQDVKEARAVVQVLVDDRPIAVLPAATYGVSGSFGGGAPIVTVGVPATHVELTTFDPAPAAERPEPYV